MSLVLWILGVSAELGLLNQMQLRAVEQQLLFIVPYVLA